MSAIPPFEMGVWNAWIIMLLMVLSHLPGQLMNKEALNKVNEGGLLNNGQVGISSLLALLM
jgi:hypothetical protein